LVETDSGYKNKWFRCQCVSFNGEFIQGILSPLSLLEMIDLNPKKNSLFGLIVDFRANPWVVRGHEYVL
jgi:hypothetical protein